MLSQEVGEAANPNPELEKWAVLHIKCILLPLEEDKLLWFKGALCFHSLTHRLCVCVCVCDSMSLNSAWNTFYPISLLLMVLGDAAPS